jgi:hypothetical protein
MATELAFLSEDYVLFFFKVIPKTDHHFGYSANQVRFPTPLDVSVPMIPNHGMGSVD